MRSVPALVAPRPPLARLATGTAIPVPPGTVTATVGAPITSVTTVPTPVAAPVSGAVASGSAVPVVATAGHTLLDHRLEVLVRRQQLEHPGACRLLLRWHDGEHTDAVDALLRLHPQLVTDGGAARQDRAVEHPAWLAGPGGAPGPRAIGGRAGQLDLDADGHGRKPYRRRPGTVTSVPIYALGEQVPDIDQAAYVHPDAVVIGSVRIGPQSSVWPNAVLRGDDGEIRIGARTSIQDGSVLHTTPEQATVVGDECVIGHIVHLEACTIEDRAMVANGAIVLHRVIVRTGAVVGANAVVLSDVEVPEGALAVGAPATIKPGRARLDDILHSVETYVERSERFRRALRRVD